MTFKEIQELIKLVAKSELSEFKIKHGDFNLHIRGKETPSEATNIISVPQQVAQAYAPAPAPLAAAPAAAPAPTPAPAPAAEAATDNASGNLLEVRSPMIGTFYRSASPDKPPYAKVGDTISKGDVICIVEAMKLFNDIESEVSGKIVKVLVEDAQPIEYDQVLFLVEPA